MKPFSTDILHSLHLFAMDLQWSRGFACNKSKCFSNILLILAGFSTVLVILSSRVPAIVASKPAHSFPWTPAIAFPSLSVPAVLKRSVSLTSKQDYKCLSWPQIVNHIEDGANRLAFGGGVMNEDMNNAKVDQITRSQYVGCSNPRNFLWNKT